jgi:hypothetical protein
MINLSDIKDPAVRMRLAIAQKEPACDACKYWLTSGITPWCKKHKNRKNISFFHSSRMAYCPDFHD